MKWFLSFFIILIVFSNTNDVLAQENVNYLEVIAKSIPEKYIKSTSNLFFTIQVGAYRNKNKSLENTKNIIIAKEDNIDKYRLGEFSTYEEAVSFKTVVLSVCNDAFIVSIKNGKRIHILEALKEQEDIF